MKRLFIILFVTQLFSTNARINSLGSVSYFIIDDANVNIYPQLIYNYSNKIIGEFTDTIFNFYIKFGNTSLGLGINSDTLPSIINKIFENLPFVKNKHKKQIALYLSKKFSLLSLGIKLNSISEYYENKEINYSQAFNVKKTYFGVRFDLYETFFDITLGVGKIKFKSNTQDIFFEDKGRISYDARIRLLSNMSPSYGIILGCNYEFINCAWQEISTYKKFGDIYSLNYNGYIGINLIVMERVRIILGNLIEKLKEVNISDTVSIKNMPKFIVANEINVNEWLKARISGSEAFIEKFYENKDELIKTTKFDLGLGLGLEFNKILFDISSVNFNKYYISTTYNF